MKLCKFLVAHGFTQSLQDYSLFTRKLHGEFIIFLVYVNDMVLTWTSRAQTHVIKRDLDVAFTIKDQGFLKYFLGTKG